jgi:hypothetical protein
MEKTHKVLDLHYHEDEGQECFDGTQQECEEFASTQSPSFMYKVVPMTKEEKENHPDNHLNEGQSCCGKPTVLSDNGLVYQCDVCNGWYYSSS